MIQDLDEVAEVLASMEAAARTGRGWVNVQAELGRRDRGAPHLGPDALLPAQHPRRRPGHLDAARPAAPRLAADLGVQHRLGAKLLPLFDDFGIERPDTWRRLQDSPRRGLVVEVPADDPHDEVLRWLLRVIRSATPLATTGGYRVVLNRSTTTDT